MKTFISALSVISAALLFISCKDNGVGPKPEDKPGRRDYVWSVDTIKIFSNNIHRIWGSAPNDIWGVGPGGALSTTIWHYDGKQWTTDNISRNISPNCVFGFAGNDVWIAGGNGKIWHYNGSEWSEHYQHTINGFIGINLYDLYGTSSNDLYAVGTVWFNNETRRGIILHYNGIKWEQKYLSDSNSYFYMVKEAIDKRCFIHCIKQDVINYGSDTTEIYEFNGKDLVEIYSDKYERIKQGHISIINGNPYFSLKNIIYRYKQQNLEEIFRIDSQIAAPTIYGRNEKDIFLGTSEGIEHYNGIDIQLLFGTEGWITEGIIFKNEVVLLRTMGKSGDYIYHGKLK